MNPFTKKLLGVLACFVLLALCVWLFTRRNQITAPTNESFTIGVVAPFTGQEGAPVYGENIKNAVELAIQEINDAGGIDGTEIRAVYEDDQLQVQPAVAAVQKLSADNDVSAIIGPVASSSTIAAAKAAESSGILLVSPASTSNEISGMSPWVTRTIAPDNYEAEAMVGFAKKSGYEAVSIVCVDNAGTKGPANIFKAEFGKRGGTIPDFEVVAQGQSDLRIHMTKVASSKPDAVYLLGYALELGSMIKQFREQDAATPILSFQVMEEPKVREIAGDAAEGVIFTTPTMYGDFATGKAKEFIAAYKAKYNKEPGIFAANAYDAVYVVTLALESTGSDRLKIRDAVRQTRQFDGATGVFDIDEVSGDSNQQPRFMVVKQGQLQLLENQP